MAQVVVQGTIHTLGPIYKPFHIHIGSNPGVYRENYVIETIDIENNQLRPISRFALGLHQSGESLL